MTAQTADQLFEEFRHVSLQWIATTAADGFDEDAPEHAQLFAEINERVLRAGEAIKSLPADAPGALRAKSALALFWYEGQDEIAADLTSEHWDTATRADLTQAAALAMCPDYVAALADARSVSV